MKAATQTSKVCETFLKKGNVEFDIAKSWVEYITFLCDNNEYNVSIALIWKIKTFETFFKKKIFFS